MQSFKETNKKKKLSFEENVQCFTMKSTQSCQPIWIFMHLRSRMEVRDATVVWTILTRLQVYLTFLNFQAANNQENKRHSLICKCLLHITPHNTNRIYYCDPHSANVFPSTIWGKNANKCSYRRRNCAVKLTKCDTIKWGGKKTKKRKNYTAHQTKGH